mmetsp:Transcript_35080/g.48653  ORF Transcript_35080/g.48653 Transcript_35080/m.48653 type:complete len:256 (-) Transcript_35080:151-918(-)|eukprot:CAMPEP_0196571516 /NCGR_PEP_ID=MMETSP1081-20130531/1676_1 /TAXON_ID=36882 /ORGANISM="Pyramimonas amylifera, Strain CCMP720" /LENGTH=255 /DNA_ID=CAMNT_0041888495 /DNA_START=48 /DNA_END=815 /DNA_ORIENTATION=-
MPVDYSKWDNLDLSDDEDDVKIKNTTNKTAVKEVEFPAPPKVEKPQQAAGSSWNLNSWHFEESKFDKWGKDRLLELIHKAECQSVLEFSGLDLTLSFQLTASKIEGEAWTHIRKGKKVTGYNYEMQLGWLGSVTGGSNRTEIHGSLDYELTVDDDEPDVVFKINQSLPFSEQIKKSVIGFVNKQCSVMVRELSQKGGGDGWQAGAGTEAVQVGQYKKYTDGVDGTALSQEVAAKLKKGDGDNVKTKTLHTNVKTV